jgi:glycosyltransferase involved in cell wall biosynthesis
VNTVPRDQPAPRVSVIIATYNYAGVLAYSIASVLDQTFPDFELIVVGDGCTDDSERVATSTGDDRVHWVNLPENTGHQSTPNNEGLWRATGEVVAFLGHDDLWLPHHLEVLVGAFDTGAVAAHTTMLLVNPGVPCARRPELGWSYERGSFIAPTSLAIRRRESIEVGGWRDAAQTGALLPEADLVARVHRIAGPPRWIPRLTCVKLAAGTRRDCYRLRPTHEQAYWLEQIRSTDDPEGLVAAHEGRLSELAGDPMKPMGLHRRAWRYARYKTRKRLGLRSDGAEVEIRRLQRLKGLR